MIRPSILLFSFFLFSARFVAQEKEDPTKMFRDVVTVEVDRAKFAPPKPAAPTPTVDPKKKKKQVEETPAEPAPDTLGPLMPAPPEEIVKRAQNWYTLKNPKFEKAGGTNSGKTVSCNVSFNFKQKILNPENDVDGKIVMDVIIEAKEGKYRYTIKNLKHKATRQGMSGGDIYAVVPECGSMSLNDRTWKHIKAEAFADAQLVIDDLKTKMREEVKAEKDEW
jgi:hypothetical protein